MCVHLSHAQLPEKDAMTRHFGNVEAVRTFGAVALAT